VLGAAIAFFAALGASVYLGYRYAQSDLLDDQVIAAWQVRLEGQQHEIGRLRETSKTELNAVGRRLASMQARLLRMEALGERVTEVANLDTGEFSFGEIPALGGPENEVANATPSGPEFISSVDQLADQLRAREDELEVLESLLANRRFHEDVVLAGRPIEKGWMSSAFGRRVDPISGQMAWHAGVDFAGKAQAEVVAVASGVVTYAGERGGYGRMVEINHGGGYVTRYGHHEELLVSAGDVVKKGQLIGRMGSTGRSTGPHVHFEVLKNGKHVVPARYVARRRES
jgi:murein DD-endopeptidase MepM/ murein hydrolase activator NlpD